MPGSRHARHVRKVILATREQEVYAQDMYGTSPWAGAAPTKGLTGNSIRWRCDPATRQGVCGDWKVPENRVPGTPIKVYLVYSMDGGPGGAYVLFALTYVVVERGADVNAAATVRTVRDGTLGANIQAVTEPIELPASLFDGKQMPIELQCTFNRYADDAGDTDPNNADLYKAVLEYTAYT